MEKKKKKKKKKNLTFTSREHDILHDLMDKAIKENPDDDELMPLYGAICSIWYKEIYSDPASEMWN